VSLGRALALIREAEHIADDFGEFLLQRLTD
jgi:hypothetical protein